MNSNVYITCMGRSGSTLLSQMLNMHPSIIAPPESFFVLHLMDKYGKTTDWTPEIKNKFIEDLYTDRPFRLIWNVPKKKVHDTLKEAPSKMTFIDVNNIVRLCYATSKTSENDMVFVDKNPIYSILFDKLTSLHPSAKVIHLVRDPRGVINSQMQSFKRKDVFALSHFWNKRNMKIEETCQRKNIEYFRVKFEDLILKQEETIKNICSFLEVDYSERMLDYNMGINDFFSLQTTHYKDKHKSTLQPLSIGIAKKWKKKLTKIQLNKIAFMTAKLARKYDYEIEDAHPNFWHRISLPFSKLKLGVMTIMIHVYFNLPFEMRKGILYFRSKIYDHKYQKH